jgi:hypothetical protein
MSTWKENLSRFAMKVDEFHFPEKSWYCGRWGKKKKWKNIAGIKLAGKSKPLSE